MSWKGFLHVSVVENPLVMQEMQEIRTQSLGWEVPQEEEMAPYSSILM